MIKIPLMEVRNFLSEQDQTVKTFALEFGISISQAIRGLDKLEKERCVIIVSHGAPELYRWNYKDSINELSAEQLSKINLNIKDQ